MFYENFTSLGLIWDNLCQYSSVVKIVCTVINRLRVNMHIDGLAGETAE